MRMTAFDRNSTSDSPITLTCTDLNCIITYKHEGLLASIDLTKMGNIWYFNRLFVHPELRGRGIASKLVDKLVSWATDRKHNVLCEINAYGDMTHDELKAFYIRHGFTDHGNYLAIGDAIEWFS